MAWLRRKIPRIIGATIGFLVVGTIIDLLFNILTIEQFSAIFVFTMFWQVVSAACLFMILMSGIILIFFYNKDTIKLLVRLMAIIGGGLLIFLLACLLSTGTFIILIIYAVMLGGGLIGFIVWFSIENILRKREKYGSKGEIFGIFTCLIVGIYVKTWINFLSPLRLVPPRIQLGSIGLIGGSLLGGWLVSKIAKKTYKKTTRKVVLFFSFFAIVYLVGLVWIGITWILGMISKIGILKLYQNSTIKIPPFILNMLIGGGLGASLSNISKES